MKTLIATLLVLLAQSSFAQSKLTPKICDQTSNKVLAQDLLNLIRTGDDQGAGNGTCSIRKNVKWVKGDLEANSDIEIKQIVLNSDDLVFPVGEVTDDGDGVFVVNYQIVNKSGNKVSGSFSFTRNYEQSWIEAAGCALIEEQPTKSFIDKSCL